MRQNIRHNQDLTGITAQDLRKYSKIFEAVPYFEQEGDKSFTEDSLNAYASPALFPIVRAHDVRYCVDGLFGCLNSDNKRGILLITRNGKPAMGKLWAIGGGEPRKIVGPRRALQATARRECNLELSDFVMIGAIDVAWGTTAQVVKTGTKIVEMSVGAKPKMIKTGGKGIHDYGDIYYAQGDGELKFNKLDNNPLIITPELWNKKEGKLADLHPYISSNMEKAMILLEDKFYKN